VTRKGPILIREEDEQIRELLERWLGEAGYAVIRDVPRAAQPPRLVIADVPSPRSAQAVIDALRAVYAAPILALSGSFRRGLAGSSEAARRLGVRKVLPIPFTRKDLLSAVEEALEGAA
jgi:CheY-like chemotaxis protein